MNLTKLYRQLCEIPRYKATENTVSEERAQEIAKLFNDDLIDLRTEFSQANECGKCKSAHQYYSAEQIFFSYVYDLHYVAACESQDAAKYDC